MKKEFDKATERRIKNETAEAMWDANQINEVLQEHPEIAGMKSGKAKDAAIEAIFEQQARERVQLAAITRPKR
jgi:hypothetical protein